MKTLPMSRQSLKSSLVSRCRFLFGAAGVAASEFRPATPARAAEFEFRCGSILPPDHPATVRLSQMWTAIERESRGRLRCQFFPNSVLGSDAAMLSQLRLGALQFLFTYPGNLASVVPVAGIAFVGFVFKDEDDGLRAMDGPLGEYLGNEAAAKNLYVARSWWDSAMSTVGSNAHPIRTPDDFRGFKIRVAEGRIFSDLFKVLGASPTVLSLAEVYTALQTRLIDGEIAGLVTIEAARWYEVNKYVSLTNHTWSSFMLLGNGDAWKRLPPDLQEIVERNNKRYALLERRDAKALNLALADKLQRRGLLLNAVDQTPFRARLKSYYDFWATEFGPKAWGVLQDSLGRRIT